MDISARVAQSVQPPNSEARNAATLSQSFAAASKSTSIAWTVLGVSTRAATFGALQERDLRTRAAGQRRLDLGAEQVIGQGLGRLRDGATP